MKKLIHGIRTFMRAVKRLGIIGIISSIACLIIILSFEYYKLEKNILVKVIAFIAYSAFASVLAYVVTYLYPLERKFLMVKPFLVLSASNITIRVRGLAMEILALANDLDQNNTVRKVTEWIEICNKASSNKMISSGFYRREDFTDFFEFYMVLNQQIKSILSEMLTFTDVLNHNQIELMTEIYNDVSDGSFLNKGVVAGGPAGHGKIPDSYGYKIHKLLDLSNELLQSFEKNKSRGS